MCAHQGRSAAHPHVGNARLEPPACRGAAPPAVVAHSLASTLSYVEGGCRAVHPDTLPARSFLCLRAPSLLRQPTAAPGKAAPTTAGAGCPPVPPLLRPQGSASPAPASSPYSGCGMQGAWLSRLVCAIPPPHAPTTIALRFPMLCGYARLSASSAPHSGYALGGRAGPWAPPRSLGGHPAAVASPLGLRLPCRPSRSHPALPASLRSAPAPVLGGPRASGRAAARFFVRRLLARRAYFFGRFSAPVAAPCYLRSCRHALWGRVVAAAPPNSLRGVVSFRTAVRFITLAAAGCALRAPTGTRSARAGPPPHARCDGGSPAPSRRHPCVPQPAKGLAGFG